MSNTNIDATMNDEALAVKASYGDELRRATFNGKEYVALRDLCCNLFGLDPATAVLKYQDEDGDKITMSSDAELREALQAAKEKKMLRLFIDVKAPAIAPPTEGDRINNNNNNALPANEWRRTGGCTPHLPMRGGFHHIRGGQAAWGFSRGGPYHRGGHPHQHHHAHQHHDFPRGGPHHGFGVFTPAPAPAPTGAPAQVDQDGQHPQAAGAPTAYYAHPHTFGHGVFTPASAPGAHPHHPYARDPFKEHKRAMKEQLKMMKLNATTESDREAIKDFKEQLRSEFKAQCKSEKKAWKAEKKAEKKAERAHCKKRDKGEKNDRLQARHVADVTVPDNSELPADTPVTKTWRLRNSGLLAWPADSQLLFVSRLGDNLNGPERVFVGAVEPNTEVDVSVTFITPSEPGRYIGYYRMASADGVKFGQRVWVAFIIPAKADAPLLPTAPLTSTAVATSSATPDAADDITMM